MTTRNLNCNLDYVGRKIDIGLVAYEREVKVAYRTALVKIQDELARLYDKYSRDAGLTYAEMTKYNRLTGLESEIGRILGDNDRTVKRVINRLVADQYEQAYFGHAWAIEQNVGVSLKWGLINDDVVRAIVNNPLKLIAHDSLRNAEKAGVRRAITQGLIQGLPYQKMTRGIRAAIDRNYKDALRIARTEAHKAQVTGTLDSYDKAGDLGVNVKRIWSATLDDRTRDRHQSLDGEPAEDHGGELMWQSEGIWTRGPGLSGDPAFDINCRCSVRVEVEGLEPTVRRTREGGIEPYMNYREWEKKHR